MPRKRKVPEPSVVTDNPVPPVQLVDQQAPIEAQEELWAKMFQPTPLEPYRPDPDLVDKMTDYILIEKYGSSHQDIPRLLYYILRELVYERVYEREKERCS